MFDEDRKYKSTVELEMYQRPDSYNYTIIADIQRHAMKNYAPEIIAKACGIIAEHIAAEFVEKHGSEIAAKLSPDAIANMTIAAAGAKVNETLNKKMPDKILEIEREVHKSSVYQRGLFGGLKRLK